MDLSYAYANVRVKAMESKLLPDAKMRELLEVKSINEMIEILEESVYKGSFVSASTKYAGLDLVTHALQDDFHKSLKKLLAVIPKKGQASLKVLLQELEVQNLSRIIASKALGFPLQDTDLVILDEKSRSNLKELQEKKDLSDVLKELRHSEYGPVLQKAVIEYQGSKDFRVFLHALNRFHLSNLLLLTKREKNAMLKKLISSRLLDSDLLVLLRIKKSNASADSKPYMVSPAHFLSELNDLKDYGKILERVKAKFGKFSTEIGQCLENNSLIPLEIALERELMRKTLRSLRLSALDFGAILSFLYLKQEEISAIRKIAYAKQYGFTEDLKQMLYTVGA